MATFSVPSSPARQVINIDNFEGVDFTNSPANIADNKSPNAANMIRDVPGKVRKRMGYYEVDDFREFNHSYNYFRQIGNYYATKFIDSSHSYKIIAEQDKDIRVVTDSFNDFPIHIEFTTSFSLPAGSYRLYYEKSWGTDLDIYVKRNGQRVNLLDVQQDLNNCYLAFDVSNEVTDSYNLKFMIVPYSEYQEKMRYFPYETFEPKINGYHFRTKTDTPLYHVGKQLIKDKKVIYYDLANEISKSWAFNDNLYIIDGKRMLKYDGETCVPVDENGYIPLVTIAKDPSGGGQQYEDLNLVCDGFKEGFAGKAGVTNYQLTFGMLDYKTVEVEIMNSQGEWISKTEGIDFTVDRDSGIVMFTTAPGVSPLTGEDNVMITAFRTVEGYADRINHCTFGTRFGVNGAFDRLFLSGNSDYPNADWYSQQWDCTYFPDTGWSLLGSSQSAIVGYSIISNFLAAHKDELEKDLSIIIREGNLVDNNPSFRIINTLQGAGAISTNSFAYLRTEPLFLTRNGLFAVTAQDITGEKYAQSRSFFLNGKLMEEDYEDLKNSRALIFNDMYLLAVKNNLYVLDGLQPIRTDRSEPYATRQYAGFYCDNLPIHYMWEWENVLYFGTENGKIFAFYKDKESTDSYNDNGEPIHAIWETADLEGKFFYKNKSFRYLAVKLGAALATSIRISGMRKGVWSVIKEDNTKGRYFSYMHLIYSKFSYSTDMTERIVATKTSIKKVDKTRFKFENNIKNEPFSLFGFAIEYTQNNNVKG